MTPTQCRMARAAARIGIRELASEAGVATATVTRFEGEKGGVQHSTALALQLALEKHGITFVDTGETVKGPGIYVAV